MRFVLNDELIEIDAIAIDSNITLLRYLREIKQLTGTKEGCASGDCGACTVLLGELTRAQSEEPEADKAQEKTAPPMQSPSPYSIHKNSTQSYSTQYYSTQKKVQYKTVNACILPLQAVEGCHVVSVEYLASLSTTTPNPTISQSSSQRPTLYPSQQAMVNCHASQCGFCTPGFVMSLTALLHDNAMPSLETPARREKIKQCIAGNLCRCTGYRPIVDAGVEMFQLAEENKVAPLASPQIIEYLRMLNNYTDKAQRNPNYWQPLSLNEVSNLIHAEPSARIIAGGTDLMLEITQYFQNFEKLIDISRVAELKQIEQDGERIRIGAAVTYHQLLRTFTDDLPFTQLLLRIGADQIRNRGTIGGNIANASPIADLPPVLLTFDADIEILDHEGQIRRLALENFYLGYKHTVLTQNPGCIIAIHFNVNALHDFHRFYKISKRTEDDIASVMTAVRFTVKDEIIQLVRIAFGGMAATPARALQAEKCLLGKKVNDQQALEEAIVTLANEFSPLSDVRASAGYRLKMAENSLRKAWLEINGEPLPQLPLSEATTGERDSIITPSITTLGSSGHA